jgi:hypothetical protein
MSTRIPAAVETSPQRIARSAGALYVITIVAGTIALIAPGGRMVANLVAAGSYVAVTILFYFVFKPVSRSLSLTAALVSLTGCVWGALGAFKMLPFRLNPLAFFGVYCLLIAWLIYNSTFLPKLLAVLMALGGLGWLTFLFPALSASLFPYNMFPGIFGETVLTLWLLVKGVDVARWREQATEA